MVPTPRPASVSSVGVVLITWPDYPLNGEDAGQLLTQAGLTLRYAPKLGARSPDELRELCSDAVAAIVSTDPFDAGVIAGSPRLRVIARVGVGLDSIDLDAAVSAGVAVTTTPGCNESTVADHTIALMLAAVRRVAEHNAAVRRGEWGRTGPHTPWDLAGVTIGLIGYGAIGKLVERRLAGFDTRILVNDPVAPATGRSESAELDELLAHSDIVSLHTPLTESTRALIGAPQLAQMRPGAILVNTSRGGVVDEQALLEALRRGHLRAAALDVFESEPPRCSGLLDLPNVIMTPHTGGISERSVQRMLRAATNSVLTILGGRHPPGLVNPAALRAPRSEPLPRRNQRAA